MQLGTRKCERGFTLVELLVAIAVIGILISLLIPAVDKVMESARRANGANNVKQIALAYNQYAFDDVNGRTIPYGEITATTDAASNLQSWAVVLARKGYLNDPSVYCFAGDSKASKVLRKSIVTNIDDTDAAGVWEESSFSVLVATNVPPDAPLSTTPVVFTRDIFLSQVVMSGATQSLIDQMRKMIGVYKNGFGYIGFLDGHVEWFDDLGATKETGKLVHYYTRKPTNDVSKALPQGCWILGSVMAYGESCPLNYEFMAYPNDQ